MTVELTADEIKSQEQLKIDKPLVYNKCINYNDLLDSGNSIAVIQLQYNYICNMRCEHCSVEDFRNNCKKRLTITDIENIFKQADELGLAHVDVTGGEPLLFKDFDQLIQAINPEKFYIQCDTNGWLMTLERAKHLKEIGVDRVQLSLDSFIPEEHDNFRNKPGSYDRAIQAIHNIKTAELGLYLSTVVTSKRLYSEEFKHFLEFAKFNHIKISVLWPKPVGKWAGCLEGLPSEKDIQYMEELKQEYPIYGHITKSYGRDIGCLAVKRMVSITQSGDVLPCPWMYFSLGNVLNTPLKDILQKGMEYFKHHSPKCLVSNSLNIVNLYLPGLV